MIWGGQATGAYDGKKDGKAREALLFLKKKKQKNFPPIGVFGGRGAKPLNIFGFAVLSGWFGGRPAVLLASPGSLAGSEWDHEGFWLRRSPWTVRGAFERVKFFAEIFFKKATAFICLPYLCVALPDGVVRRMMGGMSETVLDVKGMTCPLPVLRANRALRGLEAGDRLRVLATDRAAVADFQAFCRETGHALVAMSEDSGVYSFVIRKKEAK